MNTDGKDLKILQSEYKEMSSLDVSENVEFKGGYSYLAWANCWHEVKQRFPDAYYVNTKNEDGLPYITDGENVWVEVTVISPSFGEQTHCYPVLDNRNQAIKLPAINAGVINTAQRRALVKCCAELFGIGLSLYVDGDGTGMDTNFEPEPASE